LLTLFCFTPCFPWVYSLCAYSRWLFACAEPHPVTGAIGRTRMAPARGWPVPGRKHDGI
jgi:hypothetical protein